MTLIRIRTSAGTHRIELGSETTTTVRELREKVRIQLNGARGSLAKSPDGTNQVRESDDAKTLVSCDIRHGTMLYFIPASGNEAIPPPPKAATTNLAAEAASMENITSSSSSNGTNGTTTVSESRVKRSIDANGNVVVSTKSDEAAFRPGLTSLRSQKMHWTLTEMTELDSQYTFVMKGDEVSNCASVSLDFKSAQQFQEYLRAFKFQRPRMGWMYGRYVVVKDAASSLEDSKSSSVSSEAEKEKKYGDTKGAKRVGDLPGKTEDSKSQLGSVFFPIPIV